MRVLILQFLKSPWHYGELDAAETLGAASGGEFVIRQMGGGFVQVAIVGDFRATKPRIRTQRVKLFIRVRVYKETR